VSAPGGVPWQPGGPVDRGEVLRLIEAEAARLRALFGGKLVGARVYNDAAIPIANSTTTFLTFNSERFDTGGFHSESSNTGRLTAPTDGLYLIGAHIRWATDATPSGRRQIVLMVNGADAIALEEPAIAVNVAIPMFQGLSSLYELAAGDYVEVRVFQSSGASLNVDATPPASPEFWILRV